MHMITWLFSPWEFLRATVMEGSGVNTYKMVNSEGVGHLVKYFWIPKQVKF